LIGRICNRNWRGDGWPDEWKEGMVIPIMKKGRGDVVKNYRWITIMPTLYKIYAVVLERLREEVEEKGLVPQNQTGFRRGMGAIDNIYVLTYLITGK